MLSYLRLFREIRDPKFLYDFQYENLKFLYLPLIFSYNLFIITYYLLTVIVDPGTAVINLIISLIITDVSLEESLTKFLILIDPSQSIPVCLVTVILVPGINADSLSFKLTVLVMPSTV